MENLLDSNERTLIIFDAVCQGLNECLSLVHWDIGHMTEHRNSLAIIEQDRIRAKLVAPQDLINSSSASGSSSHSSSPFKQQQQVHEAARDFGLYEASATSFKTTTKSNSKHNNNNKLRSKSSSTTNIGSGVSELLQRGSQTRGDPHHLSGLELLDKRLADSFSQAFDLSDDFKSKVKSGQPAKPSIFQVLFGKYSSRFSSSSRSNSSNNNNPNHQDANSGQGDLDSDGEPDYKLVIDDINRQIRLAMQYSKQLEAHLFKIEDLRSRFEMHLKMGLVVRDVASAYISGDQSPCSSKRHRNRQQQQQQQYVINDYSSIGTHSSQSSSNLSVWSTGSRSKGTNQKHRRRPSLAEATAFANGTLTCQANHRQSSSALNQHHHQPLNSTSSACGSTSSNNKTTIKEFIENIDKIETEFESYMGTLLFTIEDIQGFARVCQGDVFEISIRYGESEKFKTRISVLKDNRQKCDNRQTVFKARISDPLAIKAYECKGLGKRVLLGHKLCETRDLFTARSQVMTISLNQTGSIKLNLIVTWNPLHLAPNASSSGLDITHISLPPKVSSKGGSSLLKTSSSTTSIPNQYSQNHPWMLDASQSQRL